MGCCRDHALHQYVVVGGHRQVEAEELVLRIEGCRRRSAEGEEADLAGLGKMIDDALDPLRVDLAASLVQCGDGRADDLVGIGCRIVVALHAAADVGRAACQTLGQLDLEVRIAFGFEIATEAVDRGFAHRGSLCQSGYAHANCRVGVLQDDVGDLAFRAIEVVDPRTNAGDEIVHCHGCGASLCGGLTGESSQALHPSVCRQQRQAMIGRDRQVTPSWPCGAVYWYENGSLMTKSNVK